MPHTDLAPTRRGLAQAGLLATLAATIGAGSSSSLRDLGRALDACHAARRAFNLANEYAEDPFYDEHWELREKINAVPAGTYEDLRVKARAATYALDHDPTAECHVAGSYRELSRSLIADVLRLQPSAA